ncbi:GNAT family N-acetyltransferase [Alteromonas ponticola]|uniref:GNAT family N-acetyltransferase n=1 Tax=Alteromonas aquimaris TaxID=2998417 RepID=A0ABT3P3C1_9ALTE|nr:GNAT family N-acetyltransferase [Alteromonas aquimaris]MCW8107249.1 GNAT family N-acetyltransferase [Alteromonas aquimaris]
MELHGKIHRGHVAFEELKDEWLALQEKEKTTPFIQYHWCLKLASYEAQPILISIWHGAKCVAILPLAKKVVISKIRIEGLVHLCQRFTDYQSILLDSNYVLSDCLDAVFAALKASSFQSLPLIFHYPDQHLTSVLISSANRFGRLRKFQRWEHVSYSTQLGPVKKKVINDAARRRKKLEEKGELTVSLNLGYDEDVINWILDNNAAKYGESALTAIHDRNEIHELLKASVPFLHVACIKHEENIIAAHLGFIVQNCLYYYVPVINSNYRQFSPGMIMLEQIYKNFAELNITKVDFLRGVESYKYKWGNKKQKKFALCCLPEKVSPMKEAIFSWWLKRNQ